MAYFTFKGNPKQAGTKHKMTGEIFKKWERLFSDSRDSSYVAILNAILNSTQKDSLCSKSPPCLFLKIDLSPLPRI